MQIFSANVYLYARAEVIQHVENILGEQIDHVLLRD